MKKEFQGNANKGGIYKITNIKNEKFYIGSTNNFKKRANQHRSRLNAGKHHNKHLLNLWNKYEPDDFLFEVVEVVEGTTHKRREVEQKYVDKFWGHPNFLNHKKKVTKIQGPWSSTPEETKEKMRMARRKFINSPEWDKCKTGMVQKLKGKKDPRKGKKFEEIYGIVRARKLKKRISEVNKGKNNPMFGKQHSQETISKMKQAKMFISLETRQKISLGNKGKTPHNKGKKFENLYSLETSTKMRNAISVANSNRKITDEQRKNQSLRMTGKSWGKHSQKTKELFSKQRKGISFEERYGIERAQEIKEKIKQTTKGMNAKTYKLENNPLVSPDGKEINLIVNLEQFCRDNNLTSSHIRSVIKGKLKHHKNWRMKFPCWKNGVVNE